MIFHAVNIHPMVVHFPIALLTTYTVLELLRFSFLTRQQYWFYLKATLVILGTLTSYVAYLAGDAAKDLMRDPSLRLLISKHELFAQWSLVIFSILAAGYVIAWLKRFKLSYIKNIPIIGQLWQIGGWIQIWITETKLTLILSLVGLICLLVTGALGGSIVYGPTNDPITEWIYKIFIK